MKLVCQEKPGQETMRPQKKGSKKGGKKGCLFSSLTSTLSSQLDALKFPPYHDYKDPLKKKNKHLFLLKEYIYFIYLAAPGLHWHAGYFDIHYHMQTIR